MTILQVSRDGRSLFVSNPYPDLGGWWYGPDTIGPRSVVIDKGQFSTEPWQFSRGMNLRFDEFRLRPVNPFGLSAGKTYVLFFDADNYPVVIRLRPTEVNQLQAYRVLLLAGVPNVQCSDSISGMVFARSRDVCITDGQVKRGPFCEPGEQRVDISGGSFALVRKDGDVNWNRAYITPNCDVQALTLSLTRMEPELAMTM